MKQLQDNIQLRTLAMLDQVEGEMHDASRPSAENFTAAVARIDAFIAEGRARRDGAQAFLGCMLKSEALEENIKCDLPSLAWLKELVTGKFYRRSDSPGNDSDGMFLAARDTLQKHFGPDAGPLLAKVFSHFIQFTTTEYEVGYRLQCRLMEEMGKANVNPFANTSIAFLGGEKWVERLLPFKKMFEAFHEFTGAHPLNFKSAQEVTEKVDYVISGNLFNDPRSLKDDDFYAVEVFAAAARMLKLGGKAIHVFSSNPPTSFMWEPKLHMLTGLACYCDRAFGMRIGLYEKIEEKDVGIHTVRTFLDPGRLRTRDEVEGGISWRRWLDRMHYASLAATGGYRDSIFTTEKTPGRDSGVYIK